MGKTRSGNKTSKFIREYGLTIQQLVEKYDLSTCYIYTLHLKGELHKYIIEKEVEALKERVEITK